MLQCASCYKINDLNTFRGQFKCFSKALKGTEEVQLWRLFRRIRNYFWTRVSQKRHIIVGSQRKCEKVTAWDWLCRPTSESRMTSSSHALALTDYSGWARSVGPAGPQQWVRPQSAGTCGTREHKASRSYYDHCVWKERIVFKAPLYVHQKDDKLNLIAQPSVVRGQTFPRFLE